MTDPLSSEVIAIAIVTTCLTATGYIIKLIFQTDGDNKKRRIERLEDGLKNFYWPLLIKLEKHNIISDSTFKDLDSTMLHKKEENILENHIDVVKLIENNIYIAAPDKEFMDDIKGYLKYVNNYQRFVGSDKNGTCIQQPDEKKLNDFHKKVEAKTKKHQEGFDKLINVSISQFFNSNENEKRLDTTSYSPNPSENKVAR